MTHWKKPFDNSFITFKSFKRPWTRINWKYNTKGLEDPRKISTHLNNLSHSKLESIPIRHYNYSKKSTFFAFKLQTNKITKNSDHNFTKSTRRSLLNRRHGNTALTGWNCNMIRISFEEQSAVRVLYIQPRAYTYTHIHTPLARTTKPPPPTLLHSRYFIQNVEVGTKLQGLVRIHIRFQTLPVK